MKLQDSVLLTALVIQYSDAKAIEPWNKNFNYNYYCSESNGQLCNTIKQELTDAVDSISTLMDFSPAIKFDAVVDDVSKFRIDINNELYATTVNTEFIPINDQDNIKSPYSNSTELINEIASGKNYTEDDFILFFNNFKSDIDFLNNSNMDYKNNAIKEIMNGLLTLEKLEPPYSNGYYFSYVMSIPGFVIMPNEKPKQDGNSPPSNIIPKYDLQTIHPFKSDRDICNNIERNRNETLLDGIFRVNNETCEKIKQNKLSTILRWKDKLISKGNNKFLDEPYKRLVAFADIHGDYLKLVKILRHAKNINKDNQWIAKDTILVQTGDLIDQGDETIKVLDLIIRLKEQAPKHNCEFHILYGNHEVYNLQARYFFTTTADIKSFGNLENREKAFAIDCKYGKFLRNELHFIKIINDSLFVHAGLYPEFAEMGVDEINNIIREMFTTAPSYVEMCESKKNGKDHPLYTNPILNGSKSPIDNRNFSSLPESEVCPELEKTLKLT
eukprot:jgi/Orpsp1_1/1192182/evm.model.d7180000091181.1